MNALIPRPITPQRRLAQALHDYGTLRFVDTDERWSRYETRDGDEVYLAHGTCREVVDLDDIDLNVEWNQFVRTTPEARYPSGKFNVDAFRELLHRMVFEDPDDVDEQVGFCEDCNRPDWSDDMSYISGGTRVCDSCISEYWFCNSCEEYFRETTTTLEDTEVCTRCRDNNWSFCADCDGYYRDEYASDHEHGGRGMCCDSPAPVFSIRNDGEDPLHNDERVTVALPAGVIDPEGINEIAAYLRSHAWECDDQDEANKLRQVACRLEELGPLWQTREGNFTKRLSRFAYNEFKLKLAPEAVSRVGCIARDHSTAVDFAIEVTRALNMSAEDFYHEDSCWWQSYYESRCALKTNGGFGLRTFTENTWGDTVSGRAWVMPLRLTGDLDVAGRPELTPTFETLEPDAFIVFNGYGDLEGYVPARIISHMAGMTYRKIGFTCGPMYVNNSSGYLVAPEEIASQYTDGNMALQTSAHSDLYHTEQNNEKKVLTHV